MPMEFINQNVLLMSLVVVSLIAALGLVASDQHQKDGHA